MKKLLTIDGNPKLMKGNKLGYLSAILHLAPASLSGFNMCAHSTEGCRAACLNTAGRGGMFKEGGTNTIQEARKRKSRDFKLNREPFLRQLVKEITAFVAKAGRKGVIPCVRLNGTSDILWERELLDGKSIMAHFPSVQFYDYTKYPSRPNLPANYHLTFSLAESNDAKACVALARGVNVAVVFGVARSKPLPVAYTIGGQSFPVVNGDDTDLRFLDAKGCIVGLRAKGRARKDTSGFVRTP